MTAAANFCDIFLNFQKKKGMLFHVNRLLADNSHEISSRQMIHMKNQAVLVIFEKATKCENVVCCK